MFYYAAILLVSFLSCWLFTFPVKSVSHKVGFLDLPTDRKMHSRPIPYGGGAGIFLAFITAVIVLYLIYPPSFLFRSRLEGLVVGGFIVLAFGLLDDAIGSGALLKFAAEALVAVVMYRYGFRFERLSIPGLGAVQLGWAGPVLTILWFWLMMNAINLIDGMDGLAAGITGIAALTILIITFSEARMMEAFLAIIVVGISAGFLPHNFHPAKIFMGDAGSLFLGFLMASLTLATSTKAPALLTLFIPLLAMGMPVFDTAHAFLRRIATGSHPFRADTRHLHHRLMALGLSQKRAVLFLYYIAAYLGVMAYVLSRMPGHITALVVTLLLIGLFLISENLTVMGNGIKKKDEKDYEEKK